METRPPFRAYAYRRGLVILIAVMMPLVAPCFTATVLLPDAPLALRILGLVVLLPIIVWMLLSVGMLFDSRPVLEVDEHGFLWRRWSETPIPWSAVDRWQARPHMGIAYVTVWLKDPASNPPGWVHAILRPGNKWLGMGDVTIPGGGLDRGFDEVAAAFGHFAPKPPLPLEPRLARRLEAARRKR
ncbi:hypothetical protein [Roseococcus sp. YIM B11640]|uniref:hypothetical protein n=1 Tax=Roseococcus sp. YIM B11640 TaxID=3133973 RepID=UPI003C7DA390